MTLPLKIYTFITQLLGKLKNFENVQKMSNLTENQIIAIRIGYGCAVELYLRKVKDGKQEELETLHFDYDAIQLFIEMFPDIDFETPFSLKNLWDVNIDNLFDV